MRKVICLYQLGTFDPRLLCVDSRNDKFWNAMSERPATMPVDAERLAVVDGLIESLDATALVWVSGYLAGAARVQPTGTPGHAVDVRAEPLVRATILYASQTGNGRRLAERFARGAEASGLAVQVVSAADYAPRDLARERLLFVIASTHGDGDPPDDARPMMDFLSAKRAPRLEQLGFAVLALGDSSYPRYCETARTIDTRLEQLGARRMLPRQECDVDYEPAAIAWIERSADTLRQQLAQLGAPRLSLVTTHPHSPDTASRERPELLEVLVNQCITGRGSARDVRHIELAAAADRMAYEPGDALGVLHSNPPETVASILALTGLDGTVSVACAGRELSLAVWLENEREITRLTRPFLEAHAQRTGKSDLEAVLASDGGTQLRRMLRDEQVADLMRKYPAQWAPEELVAALRPSTPRLYSIASSRLAVGDEVHLTVASVDYDSAGERRFGAASRFLVTRDPDQAANIRAYVEPNPRFRLPPDGARDVIMIGPGTGVAPFRAFVQHRAESDATGRNWLFFGARHFDNEFLYQAEWLAALKRGTLQRMDVAFSRDQADRIYVQHRMRENGAELFRWIEDGAHIYVCGDAERMAHDVHTALIDIVAEHGVRDREAASAYMNSLLAQRRYARDVY